jgi:sulfite exporter TauE/SafE
MRQACGWSRRKTVLVVAACGIAHVLSSVVIGLVGVAAGIVVGRLEILEGWRGTWAGWLLLAFGLAYMAWGLRDAYRRRPHEHPHLHPVCEEDGGEEHDHEHVHVGDHLHVHSEPDRPVRTTPWVLFIIFLFGPCEPLIPLLMYPAARHSWSGVILVSVVFGACTVGTMLALVLLADLGLSRLRAPRLERYMHALAGAMIVLCAVAVNFLGL